MIQITLSFTTVAEAVAALSKIDLPAGAMADAEKIAAVAEAMRGKEKPDPKPEKAAAPVPAATPPSAVTAPTAAPFEYATLRNKVLPLLPKHGVDPFNGIAGEFGFPNLKTLGEKGTPTQWAEAFAKVEAFEAAQAAA